MGKRLKNIILSLILSSTFLCALSACLPKEYGDFYTLQEAYDQGLLTRDDLLSISYYGYCSREDGFEPQPLDPETLSKKTENKIKGTYAYRRGIKTKDVSLSYLGTYNDCIAVVVTSDKLPYLCVLWEENIDGVFFRFNDSDKIQIWKEK